MKQIIKGFLGVALVMGATTTQAQSKLSLYVAVEETVTLGDQRSSYDFRSWDQLAANSGMRAGFSYAFNDNFSGQVTLGVVGSSRPNVWFTKIVPVEVTAQYDLISLMGIDTKYKFNADVGVGSGLVRAQSATHNNNGRFSWSEHASVGASFDVPFNEFGVLSFGLRHTFFVDDFIDATVQGEDNDRLMRFYTAVKVPLGGSKGMRSRMEHAEQSVSEMVTLLQYTDSTSMVEQKLNESNMANLNDALAEAAVQVSVLTEQIGKHQRVSIHFPTNGYSIALTEMAELQSTLEILTTQSGLNAEVVGYTDNRGDVSFNNTLSLLRAYAVVDWLVDRGIDLTRLTPKAASSSNPVVPNTSTEQRAVNRRAEIIVY